MAAHVMLVALGIKPEAVDEFIRYMREVATKSRGEAGCRRFDVLRDRDDPNKFVLYIAHEDDAAFAQHQTTEHYNLFASFMGSGAVMGTLAMRFESTSIGAWAFQEGPTGAEEYSDVVVYIPVQAGGNTVLVKEGADTWRAVKPSGVNATGLGFRKSKDPKDVILPHDENILCWDQALEGGSDEGDGWVRFTVKKQTGPVTASAVVVSVDIQNDRVDDFLKAMEDDVTKSRDKTLDPGCLRFDLLKARDVQQEGKTGFVFYEVYANDEAAAHHKTTDHYNSWAEFKKAGGVLDQTVSKVATTTIPGCWALQI